MHRPRLLDAAVRGAARVRRRATATQLARRRAAELESAPTCAPAPRLAPARPVTSAQRLAPAPLLALAALLVCSRAAAQASLFEPGLRWQLAASASAPWIPRALALDAAGELVLGGLAYQNPSLRLWSAAPTAGPLTLGSDANLAGASNNLCVALAPDGLYGWTLAQYPAPDAAHRRSELAGYDFLGSAQTQAPPLAALAPSWRVDVGVTTSGQALLAAQNAPASIVAAVLQTSTSPPSVLVTRHACASGALLHTQSFPASSLRGLVSSADGARVLLATGAELRVLGADGAVLRHVSLAASTDAVALSADGRAFAYGVAGGLVVERESAGQWATWRTLSAKSGELAARVALCADGNSAAVGWWHATSGVSLRFEGWDLAMPQRLHELVHAGAAGAPQNFPQSVAVTPDGRYFAYGAWGAGGAEPELWLLARTSATPLLEQNLPGSVQALALSDDGARVAVAHKSTHANQFATTGAVRLYDTGARDLQTTAPALLGGSLVLQARREGASLCAFALGKLGAGVELPGIAGVLGLDLAQALFVKTSACDAAGVANWTIALPQNPALIGQPGAVQALFVSPQGLAFSATVARPLVY